MTPERLHELISAYTRFNAERTLGDAQPSAFRIERFAGVRACVDPARSASYYNRIVGLTADSIGTSHFRVTSSGSVTSGRASRTNNSGNTTSGV